MTKIILQEMHIKKWENCVKIRENLQMICELSFQSDPVLLHKEQLCPFSQTVFCISGMNNL